MPSEKVTLKASEAKKIYLGLDMGTSSVGWAVTNEEYKLLRAKGKDLWGARLFDEAQTSADRRSHRCARRRIARSRARIGILMDLFADEIEKVDPGFYHRLEQSKYHKEDRDESNQQKYAIFSGKTFNDATYYKQYPTIFHLRKALIENENAPYDVRLVFLAILNMFKHRGNFLNASLDTSDFVSTMKDAWIEFTTTAKELLGIEFNADEKYQKVEEILSKKGKSRSEKLEELKSALSIERNEKDKVELLKLICGNTAKMINIFGEDVITEEDKNLSLSFRDSSYEEKSLEVAEKIGSENFSLIEAIKTVHDIGLLADILQGETFLTFARVKSYEKHKADLKKLKIVLKRYDKEAYHKFFRIMDLGNYSAYVGSVCSDKAKVLKTRRSGGKGRSYEELSKSILAILKNFPPEDPDVKDISDEISKETFLPKQLTSANGVIPNQVYVKELKRILSNAEGYLPFLNEKDESGLTVSERILKLFSFRIPYYVGPLGKQHNNQKGYNIWAVHNDKKGRIYPWNFKQMIDTKETAAKFIERMLRRCSYLSNATVLPKCSLLYEKFMVLNELNNLKVFGENISVSEKQEIYETLFEKGKKVSIKQLEEFFVARGRVDKGTKDFLSGVDTVGGFKSSLSTLGKFKAIIGDSVKNDSYQKLLEDIVFYNTVYGDDRNLVKEKVEKLCDDTFSTEQIKKIQTLKFEGWGRLSREFLELEGCINDDKNTMGGVQRSIIQTLWETNDNLMMLLSDRYSYREELEEKNDKLEKDLLEWNFDDLDGMYLSMPVRRMVWQTLKIMRELREVLGRDFDRVYVEMPREDGEKGKRTVSRKKKLEDLYKSLKQEGAQFVEKLSQETEARLRIKKLYLYYIQMGCCMYTGEPIDLGSLLNDNTAYDIDHIYPRHFVKDDSIENNLVLVKKQVNANKSDEFPLAPEIRSRMNRFWHKLADKGFITKEKLLRLTRTSEFTEEEKASFISRQLVETRQGTKAITQIIKQAFPGTDVVFSKAGEVSDFRQQYDMIKVRSINDLHHAKDAYLNIVVGNVYYTKFTANPRIFIKEATSRSDNPLYKYNMSRIFEFDVVRGDEIAWVGTGKQDKDTKNWTRSSSSFNTVKKVMQRNTPIITKRAYITHGAITRKDTVYPKSEAKPISYMAMKSADEKLQDVEKYGGRRDIQNMCYCLVSYKEKGKKVLSLEALPIYLGEIEKISNENIVKYLENVLGAVEDIQVKIKCIKYNSLLKIDGFYYYLAGKSAERICLNNALPFILSDESTTYFRVLEKGDNNNYITAEKNIKLYSEILEKLKTIYNKKKNPLTKVFSSGIETFKNLTVDKQQKVLINTLAWFALENQKIDLTLIKGSSQTGNCMISKVISSFAKEVILFNRSTTGLFESRINLLEL